MKRVNHWLSCDHACPHALGPASSARELRRAAKDAGWSRKRGKDSCPTCLGWRLNDQTAVILP